LNMRKKYRCPTTMPNNSIMPLQHDIHNCIILFI
jgi:hypothetical protein